jgi:hypothetical protein
MPECSNAPARKDGENFWHIFALNEAGAGRACEKGGSAFQRGARAKFGKGGGLPRQARSNASGRWQNFPRKQRKNELGSAYGRSSGGESAKAPS